MEMKRKCQLVVAELALVVADLALVVAALALVLLLVHVEWRRKTLPPFTSHGTTR